MEKSEGRKSVFQATVENGMENPGLELMASQVQDGDVEMEMAPHQHRH